MRKVEITDEEILIVKQALCELKDRKNDNPNKVERYDLEIIDNILKKIKNELS